MARSGRLIPSIAAAALVAGSMSFGAVVPAQAALTPQLTNFEIQGSPDGDFDWNDPYGPQVTPNPSSGLLPASFEFRNADRCGPGTDDILTKTKLDDLVIDAPTVADGQSLDKGDLCAAYAATELVLVGTSYHTVLYGAWEREPKAGQITFFIPLADGVAGNGPGDRLVEFDYNPSGTPNTTAYVREWDGNSWERGPAQPASVFQGAIQPGTNPGFGEFALDLTAAGVLPEDGPCTTLVEKYAFTQTGESDQATLKDYVGVTQTPVSNCATLIVDKVATPEPPSGSPEDFGFSVFQDDEGSIRPDVSVLEGTLRVPSSPATHPATGDPVTITDLLASPDYVVTESTPPTGWTQESLVCTGTDPLTGEAFTRTLYSSDTAQEFDPDFPLGPGLTVTCTITNLGPPSVTLTKAVEPASATGWSFGFTISPSTGVTPGATQTVTPTDPTVRWDDLTPGTEYMITETDDPDDDFENGTISCILDGVDVGSTFDAVAGQTITCTATNRELARITVIKDAAPADDEPFDFSATNVPEGDASFVLSDPTTTTRVISDLSPGQEHTIAEFLSQAQVADSWSATSVSCEDATYPDDEPVAGTVSGSGASVEITTKPGSDITCLFTNAQGSSITIIKEAAPFGTDQTFPFTVQGPDGVELPSMPIALDVNDDPANPDRTTIGDLPAGQYTVSEAVPTGWILTDLECLLGDEPIGEGEADGSWEFDLTEGQDVVCTYSNTELASVSVTKSVLPADATGWTVNFTIDPVPAGETATRAATAAAPTVTWNGLLPGTTYTVTEGAMPGFLPGTLACAGDGNSFTPGPGQAVSCAVTNTKLASVSATKSVLPAGATGWTVDFTISPVPAGETATRAATAAAPTVTWNGLLPGTTYTVTEGAMPGFLPGTLACAGDGNSFTPAPGQAVSCAVTNTKLASVSATKSVLPAGATGWTVDFTISPVPAGETATRAATAAAPTVTWNGLLPGTTYTVTEGAMPGFLPGTLACAGDGNSFTPAPGQAVSCAVTNTKLASVSATKSVLPAATAGWAVDFTISPIPPGQLGTKTATGAAPTVTWEGLVPGTQYTITEGPMPGFTSGLVNCGAGTNTFIPTAGQVVTCAVTNTAEVVVAPEEDVDDTEVVAEAEDEIAATGANSLPMAASGLWLALFGTVLVMFARRRRRV